MDKSNKILIYTGQDGLTKIDVKLEEDTLWLTQAQMCELYQTSRTNVVESCKKKQPVGISDRFVKRAIVW